MSDGIYDYVDDVKKRLEEKDKRIAELESKLAESEKSKEINIKERDKICLEMATDYNMQILELKQQLERQDKRASKNFDAYMRCSEKYTKLKQQFEEKELEAIRWEEHFNNAKMDYQCLKEQLAKKENECNQLKFQVDVKDGENAELERRIYELDGNGFCTGECWCCEYFKMKNDGYSVCTYKADQDKISFAVDKLVGVQKYIDDNAFGVEQEFFGRQIKNFIDKKIKELKKDNKQHDKF